ncbi:hypothetical protein NECAME_08298 [Necator americanus]|uniref:Uncharacterized protein n=1 Tax=Necator americanus TaxID=51031 RepID=W2TJ17_NECAM|nr:hypothetical protein NECAME_08298 [Necator americanus]ETN81758.1 hypothetical protein NECAME_08298 [Necator americanus]
MFKDDSCRGYHVRLLEEHNMRVKGQTYVIQLKPRNGFKNWQQKKTCYVVSRGGCGVAGMFYTRDK